MDEKPFGFLSTDAQEERESDLEKKKNLFENLQPEDLLQFGIIPEFIGRLPVIATLHDLDEKDLIRIMKEPKNALTKQYSHLMELDNINLKFDDDALASNVYIDIERDSENEDHVGIYNKLLFDAVNEALEKFLDARDKSKDVPWIPRNNGLGLRSNFESLAFSLKKTIEDLIFKFDDFDANPRAARRFADLDGDTRIPLNTPLTAEERLETVLTADAIEIDQSWNDEYKAVEAGVKLQIADMILEELLYDTTYHVHLVMGDD